GPSEFSYGERGILLGFEKSILPCLLLFEIFEQRLRLCHRPTLSRVLAIYLGRVYHTATMKMIDHDLEVTTTIPNRNNPHYRSKHISLLPFYKKVSPTPSARRPAYVRATPIPKC